MKKLFALLFIAALIASLALPAIAGLETGKNVTDKTVTATINSCTTAPTIDGKFNASEGYTEIKLTDDDMAFASTDPRPVQEAKDISWKLYATYDWQYVYICIVESVTPDKYNLNLTVGNESNMWQQSAIQLGLCSSKSRTDAASSGDFLEFGYGRNSTSGDLLSVSWRSATSAQLSYDPGSNKDDWKITYENNVLTYEVRIPWRAFQAGPGGVGEDFGLNVVVGRPGVKDPPAQDRLHSQYAAGVSTLGKNANYFAKIVLASPTGALTTQANQSTSTAAPTTTTRAPTTTRATTTKEATTTAATTATTGGVTTTAEGASTTAAAEDEGGGLSVGIIIAIVAGAVIVIGVVVFIVMKGKKKA